VRVGRYDYAAQFGPMIDEVSDALRGALVEGRYGVDQDVAAFEREFAEHAGVAHARGVNTGTDALLLVLMALGIGAGDEVIAQANTFHATVAAIALSGATPVLVDADPDTFLIDDDQVVEAIGPRTRAVIPVHLYGKMTPLDRLLAVADDRGLHVIEDAAQAHGARDASGNRAGSRGLAGCFSFHPSKNLAAGGDGGMVVTDDAGVADQLLLLRALGQRTQNDHVVVGLNSKLHALQAIVLRAKLPQLDGWNARRRELASSYRAALSACPVGFQREDRGEEHVYHLFQLRTSERDALLGHLRNAGIDAVVRYPVPVHLQPAFAANGWRKGEFPVAERLAAELLCLPLHPTMAADDVDYVVGRVHEFFA
jgi:dTDP-4-amino-4,6-dideoxygalactose transaminase